MRNAKKEYLREIVDVYKLTEDKNPESKTIQRVKNRALDIVAHNQLRLEEPMIRIYVPLETSYTPDPQQQEHLQHTEARTIATVCASGPELRRTQRVRRERYRGGEIKLLALQENCKQK